LKARGRARQDMGEIFRPVWYDTQRAPLRAQGRAIRVGDEIREGKANKKTFYAWSDKEKRCKNSRNKRKEEIGDKGRQNRGKKGKMIRQRTGKAFIRKKKRRNDREK